MNEEDSYDVLDYDPAWDSDENKNPSQTLYNKEKLIIQHFWPKKSFWSK